MSGNTFAGVDIGHSAVKITVDTVKGVERVIFPSAVSTAIKIDVEAEAEMAKKETVEVDGKQFFVGDTARIQGGSGVNSGLMDDWVNTKHHEALVAQACKLINAVSNGNKIYVATGLPVGLFDSQKISIREQFARHLPPETDITVVPQPMAGFYHAVLLRNGGINPEHDQGIVASSYAVVDVGYYTTDFALLVEGRWVQTGAASAPGVRLAVDVFIDELKKNGIDCDLVTAERVISGGMMKRAKRPDQQYIVAASIEKAFSTLADKVYDEMLRLFGAQASNIDYLYVIGGAAYRLLPKIRSKFDIAEMPADRHIQPEGSLLLDMVTGRNQLVSGARFIVCEGYYRRARNNVAIGS